MPCYKTLRSGMLLALLALCIAPLKAEARVVVGFGVGGPAYYPYPAYAYPPPPVYAYPPPYSPYPGYGYPGYGSALAVPPPAIAAPPGYRPNQQMSGGEACHEYTGHAVIEGQRQTIYGHACRQPDGTWRIVE